MGWGVGCILEFARVSQSAPGPLELVWPRGVGGDEGSEWWSKNAIGGHPRPFLCAVMAARDKAAESSKDIINCLSVYAVQSAQKINSLTRKHSTHAYGFSHAHVPHFTRTKTWSGPGRLFPPFSRLNLERGVHPVYFYAVLGQFRDGILVFLVGGRMVRFAKHRDPINPDRAELGSCPSLR